MEYLPILFSGDMPRSILEDRKTQTRRTKGLDEINKNPDIWEIINQGKVAKCDWCEKEEKLKLLDEDGVLCSLTGKPGILSHAYEDSWWACPRKNTYVVIFKHKKTGEIVKIKCPYGVVGDRLWAKGTHYLYGKWVKNSKTKSGRQKYKFVCLKKEAKYFDSPPRKICKKKNEIGWFKKPSIFMFRGASRITLEITDIKVERLQEITEEDAVKEGCDNQLAKIMAGGDDHNDPDSGLEFSFIMSKKFLFQHLWDSINGKKYPWESNPFVWVRSFKRVK